MAGLIIFLHGFRSDKSAWETVPSMIERSLTTFDVVSLEYSATTFSRADIETSAGRVLTEIQTRFARYDPIYLVCHSMGGVIARELCRKLLIGKPNDDALLDRIAAVVTFGTPLGKTTFPTLTKLLGRFSKKVSQIADSEFIFDRYASAITIASKRPVRRPKHIHVQIENDGITATHNDTKFTVDDISGGVVPGAHREFVKDAMTATAVADVLLLNIRNQQNAFAKPYLNLAQAADATALPDELFLIACSNRKDPSGSRTFSGPPPGISLPSRALRERVISKRSNMYYMIKDAKIFSGFDRGGNRAHQAPNKLLTHGPDLGGVMEGGAYMPAYERYTGRAYGQITRAAWDSYVANKDQMTVFIMSGLYGLVDAVESIQEYDIHLTDTDPDGNSVASMWSELFTDLLISYINTAYNDRKVKIFNLLGDEDYVAAIQWHRLPRQCSVYHLASPTKQHKALLPSAGTVLNSLLANPARVDTIQRDKIYALSDFGLPPPGESDVQVIFESRLGSSKQ